MGRTYHWWGGGVQNLFSLPLSFPPPFAFLCGSCRSPSLGVGCQLLGFFLLGEKEGVPSNGCGAILCLKIPMEPQQTGRATGTRSEDRPSQPSTHFPKLPELGCSGDRSEVRSVVRARVNDRALEEFPALSLWRFPWTLPNSATS